MKSEKENVIKKISISTMICNLLLFIFKITFGFVSKSQSMIADAVNSAGDIFASIVSYIGIRIASKPKDSEHPYGHGKAEYIFASLIGILMIIASVVMIKNAIFSLVNNSKLEYSIFLIIICVVNIIIKIVLMIYTRLQYKKYKNILLKANFEDQRNDIFVTSGVLIGIIFSLFGINFVDSIIGIGISIWIIIAAIRIIKPAYLVLMDTQGEFISEAKESLEAFDEIISVDKFIAKPVGENYIAIIEISMDKNKTLEYIHDYIDIIEKKLLCEYKMISDIIIHVNPK